MGIKAINKSDWMELAVYILIFTIPFQAFNLKITFVTISLTNIFLLFLTPFYFVKFIFNKKILADLNKKRLLILLIILILSSIVSSIAARDFSSSLRNVVTIIGNSLLIFIVVLSVNNLRTLANCYKIIIATSLLLCIITILMGMNLIPNYFEEQGIIHRSMFPRTFFGLSIPYTRNTGFITTQGTWGVWVMPSLSLVVASVFMKNLRQIFFKEEYLSLSYFLILTMAVLITQSRMVWLGYFITITSFVILYWFLKFHKYLFISLLCWLVCLMVLAMNKIVQGITLVANEGIGNIYDRLYGYSYALKLILTSLLLGVGKNVFSQTYHSDTGAKFVHNVFLQITLLQGLVGLICFILIICLATFSLLKTLRATTNSFTKNLSIVITSSWISILAIVMFYPALSDKGLWSTLGLIFSLQCIEENKVNKKITTFV